MTKLQRDRDLARAFGKAGYTTFLSGKWHNGPEAIPASFQMARSVFAGGMTDPMQAQAQRHDRRQARQAAARTEARLRKCSPTRRSAFSRSTSAARSFVMWPFNAPHDPHIVPDDFPVRYDAAKMPLPPNFLPQHPGTTAI